MKSNYTLCRKISASNQLIPLFFYFSVNQNPSFERAVQCIQGQLTLTNFKPLWYLLLNPAGTRVT
jgi:hypothetical protein